MSIISLACTKDGIAIVHTTDSQAAFTILFHSKLAIVSGDWLGLVKSLESVLKSRFAANKPATVIIVKAATGQYAASADTFKAEGFTEYVLAMMCITPVYATKHSLPKHLDCAKDEKWQEKAKLMFNERHVIKGFDAACAAAYGNSVKINYPNKGTYVL